MSILPSNHVQTYKPNFAARTIDEVTEWLNMAVFGPSGMGKTVLGASAVEVPEFQNVLFVNAEGGTRSAKKFKSNKDNMYVIDANDFRDMNFIATWLTEHCYIRDQIIELEKAKQTADVKAQLKKLRDQLGPINQNLGILNPTKAKEVLFRFVIFDSVNELHKLAMNEAIRQRQLKHPNKDELAIELADWGRSGEMLKRAIRYFRDVKIHKFWTSLDYLDKDQVTGKNKVMVNLAGKLSADFPQYFDIFGHLEMHKIGNVDTRVLVTGATTKIDAKDRTWALGAGVANPSMKKIWELILEAERKESEK